MSLAAEASPPAGQELKSVAGRGLVHEAEGLTVDWRSGGVMRKGPLPLNNSRLHCQSKGKLIQPLSVAV
jgi:hypothetical protein